MVYDHDRFGDRAILLARFTEDEILTGRVNDPSSQLRVLVSRAGAEPEPVSTRTHDEHHGN